MLSEYPGKPEVESLMDRIRLVEHEIICQSKEALDKKMEDDNGTSTKS